MQLLQNCASTTAIILLLSLLSTGVIAAGLGDMKTTSDTYLIIIAAVIIAVAIFVNF